MDYAKHTSQNILLSVNLTHGKAFFQLAKNFRQCLSSSYLHFTSAWHFSLRSFSTLRCTSSPSLTTTTSSAGVFYVLAKYFNIFTGFRTRYEYLIMANHMSWRTAWSYHLICWLVYTCNVQLHFPQFPRWWLMLGSYLMTKISGDHWRHLLLILIFKIVLYPVGIQVKHPKLNFSILWISGYCKFQTLKRLKMLEHTIQCISGCDNSKFSAVPDWYSNDYCHVLELVQTWDSRYT